MSEEFRSEVSPSRATSDVLSEAGQEVQEAAGNRAFEIYSAQNGFLLGKVLTVVEAALIDRGQLKAVKDLIRQQFREQEKWVFNICTGHQLLCAAGEEMKPV